MEQPIVTGIASFGMSGQVFHGPFLKVNPRFQVRKILERSKTISKSLFPEVEVVRTFEDILRDREIELVIVNTPDRFHYEMARQALDAGKHVLVEKPFTFTVAEADDLISLAEKKGKMLTVYQNRRWDGDFLTIQKILQSGVLGNLVEFESHFDRFRPFITPSTWKEEEGEYAGVLYNLGSHTVDQALALFGMPEAVTAHVRIIRSGGKVIDYYDIRLHYPGFAALLKCSYLVKEEGPRYIMHGTNGSFLKWGIDPQEEILKTGVLPGGDEWGKEDESKWGILNVWNNNIEQVQRIPTEKGNYQIFYDSLSEAIRFGKPLEVKPQEARDTIRILELAIKSNKEKRTIFCS
jgi:scyllo-inositol 2-dehydrogenase (NADP+)